MKRKFILINNRIKNGCPSGSGLSDAIIDKNSLQFYKCMQFLKPHVDASRYLYM